MAATGKRPRKRRKIPSLKARKVLSHAFRVRIMEVLDNREMSVSQFVDEGLIPDLANDTREEAISLLSYHFRELRRAGLIEVVEMIPGRGSDEAICRAKQGAIHNDEEWAKLSREERSAITPMTLSSFTALAELAVLYDTFDNRTDRHLAYVPMDLDEQAWAELTPVLNGVLDIVLRVREEAKERLAASGEKPIRTTWGQMMFESPGVPFGSDK